MNILYNLINLPIGVWMALMIGVILVLGEMLGNRPKNVKKQEKPIPHMVWMFRDMRMRGFDTAAFAKWYRSPYKKDLGDDFNRFLDKRIDNYTKVERRKPAPSNQQTFHQGLKSINTYLQKFRWYSLIRSLYFRIQIPIPIRNDQNKQP